MAVKLPIRKTGVTIANMSAFSHLVDADGVTLFRGSGELESCEFIVKACNAHEQLVEALKELYEDFSPQTFAQVALDDKIHALLEECK